MKNVRKMTLTLVSFIIGFAIGINFKIIYEYSTFKPYSWNDTKPLIINCYGREFSKHQMIRAISYWTIRGYHFGEYIHSPSKEMCKKEWLDGVITVRKSHSLPDMTLASTRRYSTFKTMRGAVIRYQPGSYNLDLLNEHELGHAIGFTHLEIENHIMHPRYDKMGVNFYQ